jgi:hypothetical protein
MIKKTKQIPTTTSITEYQCEHCTFTTTWERNSILHSIEHLPINKETYEVDEAWGIGERFFQFKSVDDYKTFIEASKYTEMSYQEGRWSGAGWYGCIVRQDYCMGCYMGNIHVLYPIAEIVERLLDKRTEINEMLDNLTDKINIK